MAALGLSIPPSAFVFGGKTPLEESDTWRSAKRSLQEEPERVQSDLHQNLGRRTDEVTRARAKALRKEFGAAWTRRVRAAADAGDLYVIDMSRFEALQPQSINGAPRFTPSTVTMLTRSPRRKTLTPVAILVSGYKGTPRRVYTRARATEGAWLPRPHPTLEPGGTSAASRR